MKEIYDFQIDSGFVNKNLAEIHDNDFEMEERSRENNQSRRNDFHFDGLAEKENEAWEECKSKVQEVLKHGLNVYFVPSQAKDHFKNLSLKIFSVLHF